MIEPLISVIVPVYKVEKYLNKCIESIVNQTYKNLEIILVDDGSPDNCPQICDDWAKKDKRIKVLHKKNEGAGKARNDGMDMMSGSFVSFIDSDDYISPIFYDYLMSLFVDDKIDLVECSFANVSDNDFSFDLISKLEEVEITDCKNALKDNINDTIFRQIIWNKLYKKDIIQDIEFPINKKIDDEFWTYKVISNSRKLAHSNRVLYAYRQQEDSVMHQISIEKRLQALEAKIERHSLICDRFPSLISISLCNIWTFSIYLGQLALRDKDANAQIKTIDEINKILNKYKFKYEDLDDLKFKIKIWLLFARKDLSLVCKIRNRLKIGL